MNRRSMALIAVLAVLSAPVRAQDAASAAAAASAATFRGCLRQKLTQTCQGAPGTPAFAACAKENEHEAAAACRASLGLAAPAGNQAALDPNGGACSADAVKLCPGLSAADGPSFMGCMRKNIAALSPACHAELKAREDAKADAECMAGLQKLCPGLQAGDNPGMIKCVKANRGSLPPMCVNRGKPAATSANSAAPAGQ
jgi:hypothetical protein